MADNLFVLQFCHIIKIEKDNPSEKYVVSLKSIYNSFVIFFVTLLT
jgi:hypothetical protein